MGVFNLLETVFFLSLAITFILIFLLVNHFKQRLSVIENKCNTMFEIINNMVQEINMVKKMQMFSYNQGFIPQPPAVSKTDPEVVCSQNDVMEMDLDIKSGENDKIVVSDDDSETSYDNDCNSEDDDETVNSDVIMKEDDDDQPKIKIVNMEIKDTIKVDDINLDDVEDADETLLEPALEDLVIDEGNKIILEKVENNIDEIVNDITEDIVNNLSLQEAAKEDAKEVYNKMSVQELKKMVITKGLCSDPSKLKKNELLKILEASFME